MSDQKEKPTVRAEFAAEKDDADLRQLLKSNPMPGNISLTLEREPNFFLGCSIEGDNHTTTVIRKGSEAVALGSSSTRQAFINGRVEKLGYLSQLRTDSKHRGQKVVQEVFRVLPIVHAEDNCKLYITTIIKDNLLARRVLEQNWEPKPVYKPIGQLSSLVLPIRRRHKIRTQKDVTIRNAAKKDLPEIAGCLQRNYADYQFAPYWTAEELDDPDKTRGLKPEDFTVAIRDGKIVGCLATWDQQSFKQTVVSGYSGKMRYLRPFYNIAAPLLGLPHLPSAGSIVPHAYISHMAVDEHRQDIYLALLTGAYNSAVGKKYSYLTLGLTDGNPLLATTKKTFKHLEYESIIYLVYYEDGMNAAAEIEDRILHLELAVL